MNQSILKAVLKKIANGVISRGDAAAKLQCSERSVNRLMEKHRVRRPPSPVHEQRLLADARREKRTGAAWSVLNKVMTAEEAAESADCSIRTIYRWVKKLEKQAETAQKRAKSSKNR
jgi:CRP-like cAMP-binding protein